MRALSREDLLALTPNVYLAGGYRDANGAPRAELSGDFALAAATQLMAAQMPAQELAFTYEAFCQLLPLHEGDAKAQAKSALEEALATVVRMIRQSNNAELVNWLSDCLAAIAVPADIGALQVHMQAVLRLCTVMAALPDAADRQGG